MHDHFCEMGVTTQESRDASKDAPSYGLANDTLVEAIEFLKELQVRIPFIFFANMLT